MSKTLIIAEAGVNHNGDINLAKQLIDIAADAGADIVKFQTFRTEKLVSTSARKADYQVNNMPDEADSSQFAMLKKLELSPADHQELMAHCQLRNIQFLSTAFDLDSLDFLAGLNLTIFKIPSGEMTNLPYLRRIGSYNRQVIASTGMATMDDISAMLDVLISAGTARENITVLHCNTDYPSPFQDVNLRAMQTIADTFGVAVGYSDHTPGIEVPIAAVALGATVIEKHFTLDRSLKGPDHLASLEPDELVHMIRAIRNIEVALGDGIKQPTPSEQKNLAVARKSIHLARPRLAGQVLTEDDLIMKRPGTGVSPMLLDQVTGRRLGVDVEADHLLRWEDLL
ncbi:N-acetylneuraminate synthase [Spirosoma lacussanchae]|uniref:N-acetylneuraminate synthase n=1 Tax=Spirosoma lacussanchae TaxID=1884249 RepID=UPI001107DC7E|nr:N-acetylneuraminate synthase [Spirosoma lacussanchae]